MIPICIWKRKTFHRKDCKQKDIPHSHTHIDTHRRTCMYTHDLFISNHLWLNKTQIFWSSLSEISPSHYIIVTPSSQSISLYTERICIYFSWLTKKTLYERAMHWDVQMWLALPPAGEGRQAVGRRGRGDGERMLWSQCSAHNGAGSTPSKLWPCACWSLA